MRAENCSMSAGDTRQETPEHIIIQHVTRTPEHIITSLYNTSHAHTVDYDCH